MHVPIMADRHSFHFGMRLNAILFGVSTTTMEVQKVQKYETTKSSVTGRSRNRMREQWLVGQGSNDNKEH